MQTLKSSSTLQSARSVWRQSAAPRAPPPAPPVAICTERVEAKDRAMKIREERAELQSARSVWRQRLCEAGSRYSLPLQSARSVWRQRPDAQPIRRGIPRCNLHGACGGKATIQQVETALHSVAICTERVEAKGCTMILWECSKRCNLHGACGGKALCASSGVHHVIVAICTERVEAKIV